MFSLPAIAESVFVRYLQSGYSGAYGISPAFTTAEYNLPLILVKAGKFTEVEPWTGLFEGTLSVSILTQIDNSTDPLGTHDNSVAAVYDLMANQSAVASAVNAAGNRFHLWGYYQNSYDQERNERSLITLVEYSIRCQTQEQS